MALAVATAVVPLAAFGSVVFDGDARVKPGGRLVTIATSAEGSQDERTRAAFFFVEPRRAELEEVSRLIDSGEVRPVVDAEFPLADALLAYRHKPARGKVVLRVGDAE